MTTTVPRQSRSNVVRVIASSMCFSEPPVMKNLTRAREAAGGIYDALVDAGILPADSSDESARSGHVDVPGGDVAALFGDNGMPAADPEA